MSVYSTYIFSLWKPKQLLIFARIALFFIIVHITLCFEKRAINYSYRRRVIRLEIVFFYHLNNNCVVCWLHLHIQEGVKMYAIGLFWEQRRLGRVLTLQRMQIKWTEGTPSVSRLVEDAEWPTKVLNKHFLKKIFIDNILTRQFFSAAWRRK